MAPPTQKSATTAPPKPTVNGTSAHADPTNGSAEGTVNRKKQKRRQKEAARRAAEQGVSTATASASASGPPAKSQASLQLPPPPSHLDNVPEDEQHHYSDEDTQYAPITQTNGRGSKTGSKQKTSWPNDHEFHEAYPTARAMPPPASTSLNPPPPPPPPSQTLATRPMHKAKGDRIWNTSTAEERERIKEFWLSLEETERRSLVRVEKEAVLKKMKEQQKHSCSCQVCGRKRTAIEEELEVLYDAYYDELEQYANHQQGTIDGVPMVPSRMFSGSMARMAQPRITAPAGRSRPVAGHIQETMSNDDELDDGTYSDEDEDEEEYSEEEPEEIPRNPASEFFNFGNSLSVQGGILTVADDLLKNDGKKFIEMMEQLAERRMQREEEAQYAAAANYRQHSMQSHNHGPVEEEEYEDEEEDEEEYSDEDDYDEDEMETMTEEQRMEEGRRMFQIFAARMFEQRVLTAYREKVARERQTKLLEELVEEENLDHQREAKRAKEAQKKKDRKKQQKAAKEEEKARKERERAEAEAAAKVIEEQKAEEQRQKKEEQRKKREADKKAQDEERLLKEADKAKKLQEAREHQAELERKQREQKDRDRKKREEVKKKEREEREAKEKEAKEKKERDAAERKEREARAKAEKEAKEAARKEDKASKPTAQHIPGTSTAVTPLLRKSTSTIIPLPPGLHPQQTPSGHASPHPQVATPVISKAPIPVRPRQASLQDSHPSSPKATGSLLGSSSTSPSSTQPQQQTHFPLQVPAKMPNPPHTMPPLPMTSQPLAGPPGLVHQPHLGMPNSPTSNQHIFPMPYGYAMPPPGIGPRPGHPPDGAVFGQQPYGMGQYRNYGGPPGGMPWPPGINGMRNGPQGRGMPMDANSSMSSVSPGVIGSTIPPSAYGGPLPNSTMPSHSHSHSRHTSSSFEKPIYDAAPTAAQAQPIGTRPGNMNPIQRPMSTPRHVDNPPLQTQQQTPKNEVDDLSNHLGSSALLDDSSDEPPMGMAMKDARQNSMGVGQQRPGRLGFGASPMFSDPMGATKMENYPRGPQSGPGNAWPQHVQFGAPNPPGISGWTGSAHGAPAPSWTSSPFGIIGAPSRPHPHPPRPVLIRLLLADAYRTLSTAPHHQQPSPSAATNPQQHLPTRTTPPTHASNPANNNGDFFDIPTLLQKADALRPPGEPSLTFQEVSEILTTEGKPTNGGGFFRVQNRGGVEKVRFEVDGGVGGGGGFGSAMAGGGIGSPVVGTGVRGMGGF